MQQTIQIRTGTGDSFSPADMQQINALQADGWNVVITATPVGCTATLVVLQKDEPKTDDH